MKIFTLVPFSRRAATWIGGACLAVSASAVDYQFNTATGDWSTSGNWSPAGTPTGGDRAQVNGGRTSDITSSFGTSGSRLADLNVGGNQYGAPAGNGTVNHSAGDVYTDWFRVGRGSANTGTYTKTGGLLNANQFFVGGENDNANGHFSQSAGTLAVNGNFRVGHSSGSAGTSRGTFTQSGGTVTSAPDIIVGHRDGNGFAHGTFNISNGTLSAPQVRAGVSNAGGQAWGTINQTGGTLQITGNGFRHAQGGGTAVINLSGGTMNQPGGDTVYGEGSGGNATVNHSGTHVSNSNQTWVGYNGSRGTYNMSNGTLSLAGGEGLMVGRQGGGTGIFNKTGGTISTTGALQVGRNNAQGTFTQSAGVMSFGSTNIGYEGAGVGVVNLTGGIANLGNTNVGVNGGGAGTLNISGGSTNIGYINAGNDASSPGTVNHSGGTITTSSWLGVATQNNAVGTWNASGGVLNTGGMEIGPRSGSDGVLTLSNTAQINADQFLFSHHAPGGSTRSQLNLEGGTARVDTITMAETATDFNWGSGVLTLKTGSGTIGTADLSLGTSNSPFLSHGRQMTFQQGGYTGAGADETIATGSGLNVSGSDVVGGNSVLNLGGLYLSSGVRYNKAVFNDGMSLNASAAGDTLTLDTPGMSDTVYLLRPFGFFTEDYGSLPLIQFNGGGSLVGTFDTFLGLTDDGKGFSLSTFAVTTATANTLAVNTWYLEQTATGVFFHYKVAGSVPEPDTFALLALSAVGLRTARTLRDRRRRIQAAPPA